MIKKLLSIILTALMLMSVSVPFASAQERAFAVIGADNTQEAREKLGGLLESAVEILTSPDINTYPKDACEKLEEAIVEAYGVYYNPDATAEELNVQAEKVSIAITNMKKSSVSEEAMYYLTLAITQAEAQVGTELDYTPESWKKFSNALANAKNVEVQAKSDEEVIAAADALKDAVNNLEPVSPGVISAREYLRSMINLAYKTLNSGEKFSSDSISMLEAEIEIANALYYNSSATAGQLYYEADVIVSVINLMERIEIPEEVVKYLSDVIAMADAEVSEEDEYTADSWSVYIDAYYEAVRVLNTGETEDEFIAAANALGNAIDSLVPVDAGIVAAREHLLTIINAANQILNSGEKYTAESVNRLETALNSANSVLVKENTTEQELSAEVDKVENAMNLMEKIMISEEVVAYLTDVIALADTEVGEESEYTEESWQFYFEAYLNAVNILETGKNDEELLTAANALGVAMESLVLVAELENLAAREELFELIEDVKAVEGDYTVESLAALEDALTKASEVYEKADATTEEIRAEIKALQEAKDNLKKITVSPEVMEALADAIAKAEAEVLEQEQYTSDSWQKYADALTLAKETLNTAQTDEEILSATEILLKSIDRLVLLEDEMLKEVRAELFVLIASAISIEDSLTPDSWAVLEDAVREAREVYENYDATIDEICEQIEKLQSAINIADIEVARTELYDALHSMPVGGNYTSESIGRLDDAINEGWVVYDNPDATAEEIREQTAKIQDALDRLEVVHIDADALNKLWAAIMRAEEEVTDEKDYTAESWEVFCEASYDARMTYYYGKSDEAYLAAARELNEAIDNLKPAYKALILGDVDLDGKVTIKDATLIQKSLAGIVVLEADSESVADANCDGVINIKDATEIQKHLASLPSCEEIGTEIKVPVNN